jgi:hypothetical protein
VRADRQDALWSERNGRGGDNPAGARAQIFASPFHPPSAASDSDGESSRDRIAPSTPTDADDHAEHRARQALQRWRAVRVALIADAVSAGGRSTIRARARAGDA